MSIKNQHNFIDEVSLMLSEKEKLILTELVNKKNVDSDIITMIKLHTKSLSKRYKNILLIQPLPLYLLIIFIIYVLLLSFPNEIIISWSNYESIDTFWLRFKESLILSSIAFSSLQLSMFAIKRNLYKTYNGLLRDDFFRDMSLEIVNELINKD